MRKRNTALLVCLCLTLSGCSAGGGSAWVLGILGLAALVLAGIRTYNYLLYRRRQRPGRKKARSKLDGLTIGLFVAGAVLLVLALTVGTLSGGSGEQPGETTASGTEASTGSSTSGTEASAESTGSGTEAPTESTGAGTGWMQSADGRRYYMLDDGSFVTGWMEEGSRIYYFDGSGMTLLGWNEVEGIRRYFRDDGSMARGEEVIDGETHWFTSTGAELLVVNPWNEVPEGYEVELVGLSAVYATEGKQVAAGIYDALIEMMDACNKNSGSRCCVISGYRTQEYQSNLYENMVTTLLNEGKSEEDARAEAATRTAVPGYSEHQLGLAVDIVDTQLWTLTQEQENLPAQQWLMEHCHEYGFILRYPADSTDSTGIIYEPWHYRYVGTELAQEIHDSGLTLEEYLDSLD